MVVPYIPKRLGIFCQTLTTNNDQTVSGQPLNLKVQFDNGNSRHLFSPILTELDRGTFYYSDYPASLATSNMDFIRFVADRDTEFYCLNFVMSAQNLEKIWRKSEQGALMQVFDISFDCALQRDANLTLARDTAAGSGTFCSSLPKYLFGVGLIENQYSMTIADYKTKTKFDPVLELCQRNYYDPIAHETDSKKMDFHTYLASQSDILLAS